MIEEIIDGIIRVEGGYVNNPNDSGGETKYGITKATARSYGYTGAMIDLPISTARKIYRDIYVDKPGFGKVLALCAPVGEELIDTGVNMGVGAASRMLQRALNAFNRQGTIYPDLKVDGAVGISTLTALKAYLDYRKSEAAPTMLKALNCLQGARYIELAEARPKDEDFVFGWIKERVKI